MRRLLRALLTGLSWGLTACLAALELLFAWGWLRGTLYVMRYGAAENPYAAEDAELMGIFALALLPLAAAALGWALYKTICKKRAGARSER